MEGGFPGYMLIGVCGVAAHIIIIVPDIFLTDAVVIVDISPVAGASVPWRGLLRWIRCGRLLCVYMCCHIVTRRRISGQSIWVPIIIIEIVRVSDRH